MRQTSLRAWWAADSGLPLRMWWAADYGRGGLLEVAFQGLSQAETFLFLAMQLDVIYTPMQDK